MSQKEIDRKLKQKGVSRRDFMKFCGMISATPGAGRIVRPQDRRSPHRPPAAHRLAAFRRMHRVQRGLPEDHQSDDRRPAVGKRFGGISRNRD